MSEGKDGKAMKAGVKMPKSIKRMLALMSPEDSRVCKPVLYSAVKADHHNRIQMLRRRPNEKEESGD